MTESNGDFYEGEFIDGRRVGLRKFRIRKKLDKYLGLSVREVVMKVSKGIGVEKVLEY